MTSSCFSSNFLCQSQAEESRLHLWFTQTDFKTIPERKLHQRYKVFSRRRAGIRISDNQEADCHPCHMGMLSDHCNSELHPLSPWSSGVSQGNSEAATQCCCINSISGKKSWHLLHHQTPNTLFSEAQRATVRENRKPDIIKMITLNFHFSDYSEHRCIHVFSVGFSLFFCLSEVHVFMSLLLVSIFLSEVHAFINSCV